MSRKHSILALIILAFLAAFPWGPLFAWSPVHPGYRQVQFSRANVLYPDSAILDPAYREVLTLRFHEEMSLEEIATVTRAPLSTVKSRLYRGLAALKPELLKLRAGVGRGSDRGTEVDA